MAGIAASLPNARASSHLSSNYRETPSRRVAEPDQLYYGVWSHDDAGLPCFDADLEQHPAPFSTFSHLMSTGTMGAVADQWGNIKLISTEDGPVCLTPAGARTRSGLYATLASGGELFSLIYSELDERKRIRYGTGYVEYTGALFAPAFHLAVVQEIFTPPGRGRSISSRLVIHNEGAHPVRGLLHLRSDVFIRPGPAYALWVKGLQPECGPGWAMFRRAHSVLGDVFLLAGPEWSGTTEAHALDLSMEIDLLPGQVLAATAVVGYGSKADLSSAREQLAKATPQASRQMWSRKILPACPAGPASWITDECRWSLGQLFAFENYDRILEEHYLHLGGYSFFPDLDDPRPGVAFTVREAAQNALVIAACEPALAKSTLRWLAAMQLESGDIPKNYNFTRERRDIAASETDSDTELWFLLALCEYIEVTGDMASLDESLTGCRGDQGILWDHVRRAFTWITESICIGTHGLLRILDGDWNDYLSQVGAEGKGESVMNSGMAARAFGSLSRIAAHRSDLPFAARCESWQRALQEAVGQTFDREWFTGCYSDSGAPVAGFGDRVYLNAQSWAVLGKCGTPEQRRMALLSAVRECQSRIGLLLMSQAYSSPAPHDISWCPIPRGEGENGGVWPQACYWAVWALSEEGLFDVAAEEWEKATLRNHARSFPYVPYGIYNAPDCWSSRLAGAYEGWTQNNLFNRNKACPMSPMIAWQAFTLRKLHALRGRGTGVSA